ncbi:DUF4402 domain-containing protein [Sphingomicrobium marinum]|uniref:DUF4402 domain-containing protein n=1 Tax=Sphingomicrobium marinum TaxID=1227950 RepID=UPI00223F226B|nr:DUF4402 domain-containing protein [Sphingomicrobium marinum]
MTGRFALFCLAAVAVLATLTVSVTPAAAQCRLCDTPELIVDPVDKAEERVQLSVETMLDFDQLVVLGDGSATLAATGARMTEGGIAALSARAMVGEVVIRGEAGRRISISLPSRIELHNIEGGRIRLESIEHDLPSQPELDANGELRFRFGGRLEISGAAEGDYRGDVPIVAEYR